MEATEREQTKNLEVCILMASTDAVNMRKIRFGCHSKLRVVSFSHFENELASLAA